VRLRLALRIVEAGIKIIGVDREVGQANIFIVQLKRLMLN
jgi:hypothetical protein